MLSIEDKQFARQARLANGDDDTAIRRHLDIEPTRTCPVIGRLNVPSSTDTLASCPPGRHPRA